MMSTQDQQRTEETLRKELGAQGAREYEIVALTMVPERGLAALRYAVMKGAEHPISYAIKLFDNEEWHPRGETARKATNLHAGLPKPLPLPRPEENLEEAKRILEMLKKGREYDVPGAGQAGC